MSLKLTDMLASQRAINQNIKTAKSPAKIEEDKVAAAKRKRIKKKTLEQSEIATD